MRRPRHTRSSLFLMELIIAILFFSAGSAVCIQAFVQAYLLGRSAEDLSFASAQVSSAASVIRYTNGESDSVRAFFADAEETDDGYLVYYDSAHQPCPREDAYYTLVIRTARDGVRADASLSMEDLDGQVIYELSLRYPAFQKSKEDRSDES